MYVETVMQAVDISEASPSWQDYIGILDDVVRTGLLQTTICSLQSIYTEIVDKAKVGTTDA